MEIDKLISKNLWLPVRELTQVTKEDHRYYLDESTGDKYFSVTTILSYAKPNSAKKALQDWRNLQVAEGKDPNQASIDGDAMHKLIESYIASGYQDPPIELCKGRGYRLFKQYKEGFLTSTALEPKLLEGKIYSEVDGMRFAGTIDLVTTVQITPEGKVELAIVDHKSISDISKSGSRKKDYLPQIGAYAKAVKDRYGVTVECAYINFASEKSFKSYRISLDEIKEGWDTFYYALHKFYTESAYAKNK